MRREISEAISCSHPTNKAVNRKHYILTEKTTTGVKITATPVLVTRAGVTLVCYVALVRSRR